MRWITGAFSTTPITALEVLTNTPPITAQLNIIAFKYALRVNRLSAIHPIRRLSRTFQFETIRTKKIKSILSPFEKYSVFNMCRDPSLVTDERFTYNHEEQILGTRITDLFKYNIKFLNFDHPKKGTDLFNQWFRSYNIWLNTIRNERDHLIIATDGSFQSSLGTAAFACWINNNFINSKAKQINAHSSYDAEIQAIQLALSHLKLLPFKHVTLLVDNEAAATSIWKTDYHNMQYVSIKAMMDFRTWTKILKTKDFTFNVSWCPAHMNVKENEYVDALTNNIVVEERDQSTTLASEVRRIQINEFDQWNRATKQYNHLGHQYLRLKYKGKRIGPSLGQRKKAFIEASNDNINLMSRLTQIITNHAPTGEFRKRFFPTESQMCNFDGEFHSRTHILTKCTQYEGRFKNLEYLCRRKDGLERLSKFL
ncbi:hypothetical protein AX15_007368 [Amanita polypyramis BW_CC]|nr:hypothetical protein AX15_007368 [Amanita polypyramis BW_CC]